MEAQILQREIERFDPSIPIEEAWTPPASWYVAPAFDHLERQAVFPHTWQIVGRIADLVQPQSYLSACVAGEPVLVVRDEEGLLRAFHNVCRHKASQLLEGQGTSERIQCPYHGWVYDLDGTLRSAPRMAGVRDFDRRTFSLAPMAVATWGHWIFVHGGQPAAKPQAEWKMLQERLQATRWEELRFHSRREWVIECNWKVYVDNYLDGGYHVPIMHPSLSEQLSLDSYRTELFDSFSIQSCGDDQRGPSTNPRTAGGAVYAWVYPNLMINRYGPCLDTNRVLPLGPTRCRVIDEFWFDGTRDEAFRQNSIEQSAMTQREDILISERVQRGLASPSYDRGRYAPKLEIGEHHFHGLLAHAYRKAT